MPKPKRWNIAPPHALASELAGKLKVSPVLAQVLLTRGFSEPKDCQDFLRPSLKYLHDPNLIAGVPKAAERIARAIKDQEKIVVYGDYDVDGITAVSILWHAIRTLGGLVEYYIPHRIEEGYGLNPDAVTEICDGGAKLIITVDCGVTAIAPALVAKERAVDLIITDHHEWKESAEHQPMLPDCYAIVHPRLPAENGIAYPNPSLCGAGVAFKLAWAIGQAVSARRRSAKRLRHFY